MSELIEIINILSRLFNVLFIICFAPILVGGYRLLNGVSRNKSNFLSISIFFMVNFSMYGYQLALGLIFDAQSDYPKIHLFCWYMGFAWFDLIAIYSLYFFHKKENLHIERLGQFITANFALLGFIQLIQYSEILIFSTQDMFDPIYSVSIPIINLFTFSICFTSVVAGFILIYMEEKHRNEYRRIKKWLS